MRLLEIGRGEWVVYAICTDDGVCPTLEALHGLGINNHGAIRAIETLSREIPLRGPDFHNREKVLRLKNTDGIYELREQPRTGPKIRVLFFRAGTAMIICTGAFEKRNKTPRRQVEAAEEMKRQYENASRSGKIVYDRRPPK